MSKILFASDFHLGVPEGPNSLQREKRLVRWLESFRGEVDEIYFLGDVFDFWFEYKYVIPKGYSRLFGIIADYADKGVKIHFFKGNHDMWMFGYFEKEFNAEIHDNDYIFQKNGKKFYLHHGDGLGDGDKAYKLLKKVFRSKICQRLFAFLHPSIGIGLARFFSARSRAAQGYVEDTSINLKKEWLFQYCEDMLETQTYDYMIFGHRHLPLDVEVKPGHRYINLGDWLKYNTYAVFDGTDLVLKTYED